MRLCPSCRHPWSEHTIGKGDHVQFGCYHGAMDGGPKTCPCDRKRPKISAWRPLLALALASIACGYGPAGPDTVATPPPIPQYPPSAEVVVQGGTPEQTAFVNSAWQRLMVDLDGAGMALADPRNARGLRVLMEPSGSRPWLLARPGEPFAVLIGNELHVPGGFMLSNHARQTIAHDALHYFCGQTLGHHCLAGGYGGPDTVEGHRWATPSGRDAWVIAWDDGRP